MTPCKRPQEADQCPCCLHGPHMLRMLPAAYAGAAYEACALKAYEPCALKAYAAFALKAYEACALKAH